MALAARQRRAPEMSGAKTAPDISRNFTISASEPDIAFPMIAKDFFLT
jgi:hypothetical protein